MITVDKNLRRALRAEKQIERLERIEQAAQRLADKLPSDARTLNHYCNREELILLRQALENDQ